MRGTITGRNDERCPQEISNPRPCASTPGLAAEFQLSLAPNSAAFPRPRAHLVQGLGYDSYLTCWSSGTAHWPDQRPWTDAVEARQAQCLTPSRGASKLRVFFLFGDSHAAVSAVAANALRTHRAFCSILTICPTSNRLQILIRAAHSRCARAGTRWPDGVCMDGAWMLWLLPGRNAR